MTMMVLVLIGMVVLVVMQKMSGFLEMYICDCKVTKQNKKTNERENVWRLYLIIIIIIM